MPQEGMSKKCDVFIPLQQRDAIMRDLAEERQSRLDAEKRLKEALLEGETYKSRLEALQQDLSKMQGMLNSVMEYKSKIEQLKEEHSGVVQNLEVREFKGGGRREGWDLLACSGIQVCVHVM